MKTKANIGDVYGRLTILQILDKRTSQGHIVVETICSCGNIKVVEFRRLRSGVTKSCGCLKKELLSYRQQLSPGLAGLNELYSKYKQSALKRGYSFDLSKEVFKNLTQQSCYYCGSEPKRIWQAGRYNGDYIYNGLDRIDNTQGYFEANVVSCCSFCNYAKRDRTYSDFIEWLKLVGKRWALT